MEESPSLTVLTLGASLLCSDMYSCCKDTKKEMEEPLFFFPYMLRYIPAITSKPPHTYLKLSSVHKLHWQKNVIKKVNCLQQISDLKCIIKYTYDNYFTIHCNKTNDVENLNISTASLNPEAVLPSMLDSL